jgi:hypothetical protein
MNELPPFLDQLTRHQYRLDGVKPGHEKDAQKHAEEEGHVPPGVGPVKVSNWAHSYDYVWEWITGTDSTGRVKEMWFADGPFAGQPPRAIDADTPARERIIFQTPRSNDPDAPASCTYELYEREDGLWYGRWAA